MSSIRVQDHYAPGFLVWQALAVVMKMVLQIAKLKFREQKAFLSAALKNSVKPTKNTAFIFQTVRKVAASLKLG